MNENSMTIIPEFLKEIFLMTFTSKHENCILGSSLKRQHTDNGRFLELQTYRPIRGGHEKPSFRLGGGGRLQNAPSANAFL